MRIKNWDKFQHFKHKTDMKWFKMYGRDLLNNTDFMKMDDIKQAFLVKLWCLASESNGILPNKFDIAFRLRKDIKFVEKMLLELDTWIDKQENIQKVYTNYITDKIRLEEDKIIKNNVWFDKFWECFPPSPRKVNKSGCLAKWKSKDLELIGEKIVNHVMMAKSSEQWTKNKGEFIPMPMTYLNQERWDVSELPIRKVWEGGI